MENVTRRTASKIVGAGLASAALLPQAGAVVATESSASPSVPAFAGKHQAKPLPFDAAKLTGLSEKLIVSHHDNNYVGSVKALNMIEARLAEAMTDPDLPPVVYGGLKREELHRTGSVILHEEYFASLGGDGKPGGEVAKGLATAFGSVDAWMAEFKRTAMSLAGGSGWCVLVYNFNTGSLHNQWAWDHMHGGVAGVPLLPLDMYEHAFHMDYGTAAAKYIDAVLANVKWEEVDRRYSRALRMAEA